jgi:hypothetical protein
VEKAMKPKVTLALVIVLVALGGYVYFFEIRPNRNDEADSDLTRIYGTEYSEYDIIELEIEGPQGTAHFARTDETSAQAWEMLLPTPLPPDKVDQARVNGAATRMGYLTASRVITNVTDLAQYGLEPPELTVTLTISNGQEIMLYTGNETPVQNNRYIRLAGDDKMVYLVFSFAVDDLHRLIDEPPFAPTQF